MSLKDSCDIFCFNEDRVNKVKELIKDENFESMSKLFKILSDQNRLKIALTLSHADELCVCDVAHIIGSSVATASHHLRALRKMGLANYRKDGKLAFYSLNNIHIKQMIVLASSYNQEVYSNGSGK